MTPVTEVPGPAGAQSFYRRPRMEWIILYKLGSHNPMEMAAILAPLTGPHGISLRGLLKMEADRTLTMEKIKDILDRNV